MPLCVLIVLLRLPESTPLSRAFARQGVKIPIRKDVSKGKRDGMIEDEEDD